MGSRNYEQSRINLISDISQGKPFSKLSTKQKEHVVRIAFLETGREVEKDWLYTNSITHIPFTYTNNIDSAWNGIRSKQVFSKFMQGQESNFSGLEVDQKIRLIENYLSINYGYTGPHKLEEEITKNSTIKSLKISLYCPIHGWNKPIRAQGIIMREIKQACTSCEAEAKSNSLRMDINYIRMLWNSLDRIVDKSADYVNNETPIPFYSTKFNWPAQQAWNSFKTNYSEQNPNHDPHDIRTLVDKPGYLLRELEAHNQSEGTDYKIDPNWSIPDSIGPKMQVRLLDPQWLNYSVEMNWYDFFVSKHKPIFKSIINKTRYVREFALLTGRIIIPYDWKYQGDAHALIKFISEKKEYEGYEFENNWNHISNGLGHSVQAMCNKSKYFAPLIEEFGYQLESKIIDKSPMSQIIHARCSDNHKIARPLREFQRSPETFCTECFDRKPDRILDFCLNPDHANSGAYVYYVLLKDIRGTLVKKIGITNKTPVSKRFSPGIFQNEIVQSDSIGRLSRASAFCIESFALKATKSYQYSEEFFDSEDMEKNFAGKTELRNLDLDDLFMKSLLLEAAKKVRAEGWMRFALNNLKLTRKEQKLLETGTQNTINMLKVD